MFLFFQHIGFSLSVFVLAAIFCIASLVLVIRGIYVVSLKKIGRTTRYLGILIGCDLIFLTIFILTGSDIFRSIRLSLTVPFGLFAQIPIRLLVDIPEPVIFSLGALLNFAAIVGLIELIGKFRSPNQLI
jgi:hypothetical protein